MTAKYVSWGQVKRVEREKEAARAATVAPDAMVAPGAIAPDATVAANHGEPWHGATVAPDATVVPSATVAPDATVRLTSTVRPVDGYCAVPNTVLDSLWEVLDAYQAKVYVRLLRLTRGYKRDTCRVGYDRLAASCRLSRRKAQDVVAQLIAFGLVERLETAYGGEKGTTYRVIVPGETVAQPATVAPRATQARRATVAPDAGMKALKERHETPTVYEIRTIAARLFEAHRGELGFDHDRLRDLVREALIGQGSQPDANAIEDAIRGMAV